MSYRGRFGSLPTIEHIVNGGMELSSGSPDRALYWDDFGSPEIWQIASSYKYSGSKSTAFVSGPGANIYKGIVSDTFTTTTGATYYVSVRLRRTDSVGILILVWFGDGTTYAYNPSALTPALNTWFHHTGNYTETKGGSSAKIAIISNNGNLTCYVDDVSITSRVLGKPTPFYKDGIILQKPRPKSLTI